MEPSLRHVDSVARFLLAPLLERRVSRSGWKLVDWDAEQGISVTLGRGGAVVLVELEQRNDGRDCYARTARFNVCARRQFESPPHLEPADRAMLDALVAMIEKRERALPTPERQLSSRHSAVRSIKVDRALIAEGRGHYYLNPYAGCMIGCEFCYVAERADFSRALEGLPALPWGHWVDVKENLPELLVEEVKLLPPGLVRLSPILTDPYQPLERRFRVTRRCLEVLLTAGFTPGILTRAARVTDDLELLGRFPRALVGLSIPTDDDRVRRLFEPGADPVEQRIEALERCRQAGLHTFAVIQPVLPMDAERLVGLLAPLVEAVRIDRLHARHQALHLYRRAGLESAASDAFFETTERRLREGFAARGVHIDELDDMASLVAPPVP